jgi:hypothetical protein
MSQSSLKRSSAVSLNRGRKEKEIDFNAEAHQHQNLLRKMIGKPVPLSRSYTQGEQPILVAIEDDTATVRFRNGAVLTGVPIRDLVDDAPYWRG